MQPVQEASQQQARQLLPCAFNAVLRTAFFATFFVIEFSEKSHARLLGVGGGMSELNSRVCMRSPPRSSAITKSARSSS